MPPPSDHKTAAPVVVYLYGEEPPQPVAEGVSLNLTHVLPSAVFATMVMPHLSELDLFRCICVSRVVQRWVTRSPLASKRWESLVIRDFSHEERQWFISRVDLPLLPRPAGAQSAQSAQFATSGGGAAPVDWFTVYRCMWLTTCRSRTYNKPYPMDNRLACVGSGNAAIRGLTSQTPRHRIKICVIGERRIGKTSFLKRMKWDEYLPPPPPLGVLHDWDGSIASDEDDKNEKTAPPPKPIVLSPADADRLKKPVQRTEFGSDCYVVTTALPFTPKLKRQPESKTSPKATGSGGGGSAGGGGGGAESSVFECEFYDPPFTIGYYEYPAKEEDRVFLSDADVILLLYAKNETFSFRQLQTKWAEKWAPRTVPVVVAGTRSDTDDYVMVSESDASHMCEQKLWYSFAGESSAVTGRGVICPLQACVLAAVDDPKFGHRPLVTGNTPPRDPFPAVSGSSGGKRCTIQ